MVNLTGTDCFLKIFNCEEHAFDSSSSLPRCVICVDGYFLVDNYCELGGIPNCLKY